ncbi:M48 family metallopeptidase [Amorphus sp. 3PC139-8]|uniref:M48 family metallopeptidase n=1 Tax=Amorphus sp. 3PC139-8 TaxID=2735676 RepID=UPI00345C9DB6
MTSIDLDLPNGRVTVQVRWSRRARRATLRLPTAGEPVVTAPQGMSNTTLERFVKDHAGWLAERLARQAPCVPFEAGAVIPVRGVDHEIRHMPGRRGTLWIDGESERRLLCVTGEVQHLPRRVRDGLKRMARDDLSEASHRHARKVDRPVTAIRIRETRSQWGSCSHKGALSFSWRLVMAPPFVLDYVAAHEVAHLIERNHSHRFWKLTERLAPQTPEARLWLKAHGQSLFAIGSGDRAGPD